MGSLFGDSPDPIAAPDYSQMEPLTNKLYEQVNNNQPWRAGQETPGQAQFKYAAQQGLEKTMQGQAAMRGIRPSQKASMANTALANQQAEISGQAAIRDAMEREAAQNQLANIFLQQQGQKIAVNQANQQNEQQAQAGQDRMLGMGLTAAGYAFGGPAAGMATGALTSGMGSEPAPTNMGANPYAGAAQPSAYQQYNPSRYNMGQGLQLNGGY